ncbi:23S rRNA (adenine(2058)-N(6))-methyltransferase Erm(O) [Sphaerisporangium krabiense]|uniref:23S rRNA (Adenine-N6)-dimethyltransferase n=1 Tax=Sphaerisporangium krabiense TaxID=763782 RepID=A0A7W8Z0Q2_9ACTN|nr:ErmE/ErmH/ErmO/ErmR family 23S rRNA (adenine(2058)-N(6))-methyltransferase [Sphaerisporangium krabiense]MBB5625286.1 23S rRNA (adenine-N6)-dimethyltransferase [Sphaerisporangium krabiense]GII64199.1 23S rRNA (adenine(2058)-N(6))-methyltransferase Erm(O) [Sphaerisporangium krabiense]
MARSFAHGDFSHTQKRHTGRQDGRGGGRTERDRARRELSQNFLIDRDVVARIVETAGPRPGDLVLEPGAGEGVLTRALAARAGKVVAYEIDVLLAGRLAARTRDDARIEVVRGDFLAARAPREPFAVVGNIPYAATSRIVDWCLRAPALTGATLLTQLEYARKRTGDFGRWSLLTVRTWPWFSWSLAGRVGREAFRPVPAVDSAVLRLDRRPAPLLPPEAAAGYDALVDLGFQGVGGTLRASLLTRHTPGHVDAALAQAGIPPATVVAHVHPDRWTTLWQVLQDR